MKDDLLIKQAAEALGVSLTAAQLSAYMDYVDLLLKWNSVINLTAIKTRDEVIERHIVDCLTVVPQVMERAKNKQIRLADIGCGAGLPSIVIAIAAPEVAIDCVETVAKKCRFLQDVKVNLSLSNVRVLNQRVEQLVVEKQAYAMIVCRAFSSLVDFVRLTAHLGTAETVWLAMKAKQSEDEQKAVVEAFPGMRLQHQRIDVPFQEVERMFYFLTQTKIDNRDK